MAVHADKKVKSVTRFEPGPTPMLPPEQRDLAQYVITELRRLSSIVLNQALFRLEPTHATPEHPRKGDIRYADGTNWNPGSTGEGIYFFNGTSWTKL